MDWEPYMGDMYTRFMNSFNLPVTYGGSGVRLKHGMSGQPCLNSITQVHSTILYGAKYEKTC